MSYMLGFYVRKIFYRLGENLVQLNGYIYLFFQFSKKRRCNVDVMENIEIL